MAELNEWDYRLIRLLKGNQPTFESILELWEQRCGMERRYVLPQYPVEHMLEIVSALGLGSLPWLVKAAHPENLWRFPLEDAGETYWGGWARVLGSTIRNAKGDDLPGYREWLETQVG
jgi:hypothetical protein